MSTALTIKNDAEALFALVTGGDCGKLSAEQRVRYYQIRCEAAGLDPRTQPFEYTNLNGKLVLYARKAATDQLTQKYRLSFNLVARTVIDGLCVVEGFVEDPTGRRMDDLAAVNVQGKKGDDLANAMMKAVTKCRRRAVLSFAGLGMNDETELETVPRGPKKMAVNDDGVVDGVTSPQATEARLEAPPQPSPRPETTAGNPASPVVEPMAIESRLTSDCLLGWKTWEEKRAWRDEHQQEKDSLPLEAQARLSIAFTKANPRGVAGSK